MASAELGAPDPHAFHPDPPPKLADPTFFCYIMEKQEAAKPKLPKLIVSLAPLHPFLQQKTSTVWQLCHRGLVLSKWLPCQISRVPNVPNKTGKIPSAPLKQNSLEESVKLKNY